MPIKTRKGKYRKPPACATSKKGGQTQVRKHPTTTEELAAAETLNSLAVASLSENIQTSQASDDDSTSIPLPPREPTASNTAPSDTSSPRPTSESNDHTPPESDDSEFMLHWRITVEKTELISQSERCIASKFDFDTWHVNALDIAQQWLTDNSDHYCDISTNVLQATTTCNKRGYFFNRAIQSITDWDVICENIRVWKKEGAYNFTMKFQMNMRPMPIPAAKSRFYYYLQRF
jgi:hypothetical protein